MFIIQFLFQFAENFVPYLSGSCADLEASGADDVPGVRERVEVHGLPVDLDELRVEQVLLVGGLGGEDHLEPVLVEPRIVQT